MKPLTVNYRIAGLVTWKVFVAKFSRKEEYLSHTHLLAANYRRCLFTAAIADVGITPERGPLGSGRFVCNVNYFNSNTVSQTNFNSRSI